MSKKPPRDKNTDDFLQLSPEGILDAVESVMLQLPNGVRATGRSLALNSLENRVYDVELEDDSHVVAKFYRPGRWSEAQIQEEHQFLFALQEAEIPVVAPLKVNGKSVFRSEENIIFALFPKVKGRLLDELDKERLTTLGRYIARIHNVGERFPFKYRLKLSAEEWGRKSVNYLLSSGLVDPVYEARFRSICDAILLQVDRVLKGARSISVHGDCHLGNTLWQLDSPFFLDFDDSMTAPPVQDIWMVVRGRGEEADHDRDILLAGYEAFRDFDRSTLKWIEPLRALRMIHYSAWIARRWEDPSFKRAFPQFGSPRYWEEEIQALQEILAILSEESQF